MAVAEVQLAAVADAEVFAAAVAVAHTEVAAVAGGHRTRCRGGSRAVARIQPGIFSVFGPQNKSSKFLLVQFSIIVPIAPLKYLFYIVRITYYR